MERLNAWLTLIANFGVVAGLIFLGIEVEQNTTALRAAAIQESTDIARELLLNRAANEDLNRVVMMGFENLDSLDQGRAWAYDRSFWLGMQGQYRQWRLGFLPVEEWTVWNRIICSNYANRSPTLWEGTRATLLEDFTDFVEANCEDSDGSAMLPR